MASKTRPAGRRGAASPPGPAAPPAGIPVATAIDMAYRHWEAGQAEQAEALCRDVLAVWPGQADVLHLLGLMEHASGRLDTAIVYLRQACAVPDAPAAYFSNLAELCRQRGRLRDAEDAARKAVERDPTLVAAWSNLGIILQEAGKLEESAQSLERAVAIAPDAAEIHNNLGNTLRLLNRFGDAAARYDSALMLNPRYVDACCNLGSLLGVLGEPEKGLALLRRAIEIEPRAIDAYTNAVTLESDRERWQEAFGWLEALRDFAPTNAKLLAGRARVLRHLGRLEEALAAAEAALAAAPNDAAALLGLATALQALDRFDEALVVFARLADLPSTAAEAGLVNSGALLMELGRFDEAKAVFAAARSRFPCSALAWYGGMELLPLEAADVARLEGFLAEPAVILPKERSIWHFVLGNAHLRAGDRAAAFQHFEQGNSLKRATFSYDADATDRWLEEIARAFPAELFQDGPLGSERPVFVVGMPRSGSGLVEQILVSHHAVRGIGERGPLAQILNDVARAQPPFPAFMSNAGPEIVDHVGQRYLDHVNAKAGDAARLVDKMTTNFLYAGLIALALPGARIVHVRRDPLDCCLSNYTRLFLQQQLFTYDMVELGRFHRGYERLMAHWRQVLPSHRFLELDYEELVTSPERQVRRLIEFCGLEWDPACLEFHRTERRLATTSAEQVRQPIFRDSIGRGAANAAYLGPLIAALGASR